MLTIRSFRDLKAVVLYTMGLPVTHMGNSLNERSSKLGMHFVACTTRNTSLNQDL